MTLGAFVWRVIFTVLILAALFAAQTPLNLYSQLALGQAAGQQFQSSDGAYLNWMVTSGAVRWAAVKSPAPAAR